MAIVFGWIIAVVLLYIVGILIICKCVPLRREDQERMEDNGGSKDREKIEKSKSSRQKENGMREDNDG